MKPSPNFPGSFLDDSPAPAMCGECGKSLDAATGLTSGERPAAGSVSVCAYCGSLAIFEDSRLLRAPSDDELAEIQRSAEWPLIARAQQFIRERNAA